MLSFVQRNQYYQIFLTQALGMGIGYSLVYVPTMTLVTQHMKKHRALAMVCPKYVILIFFSELCCLIGRAL
jgi:hypothetical protein